METVVLRVAGMSCQMCVKHVARALEGVAGVSKVKVSLEEEHAVVTFDPAVTDTAEFKVAVAEAGYQIVD
ncbi:MAG: heavy-metal-associated domain-containing protein [Anaerolineae bacterium]|nr:heavy-metal-associated domain-containing protein [Anaerolineae bacterium]